LYRIRGLLNRYRPLPGQADGPQLNGTYPHKRFGKLRAARSHETRKAEDLPLPQGKGNILEQILYGKVLHIQNRCTLRTGSLGGKYLMKVCPAYHLPGNIFLIQAWG
jgi:hypothetical protein